LWGHTILELWPETAGYPTLATYREAMAENEPRVLTYRHQSDVHDVWLEVRCYPVEVGLAIFYRDVTAAIKQDSALRESEDRSPQHRRPHSVMLWVTDESGYCTYLNRTWYDIPVRSRTKARA
jgi:PAS domain-containing protein